VEEAGRGALVVAALADFASTGDRCCTRASLWNKNRSIHRNRRSNSKIQGPRIRGLIASSSILAGGRPRWLAGHQSIITSMITSHLTHVNPACTGRAKGREQRQSMAAAQDPYYIAKE